MSNDRPILHTLDRRGHVVDRVEDMLTRPTGEVLHSEVWSLADDRMPQEMAHVLPDLLTELALGGLTVTDRSWCSPSQVARLADDAPPGLVSAVALLDLVSGRGVQGRVWVSLSDRDALSGVRLEVDTPAVLESAEAVRSALRPLDPSPGIAIDDDLHPLTLSGDGLAGPSKDVASLSKLFVLEAALGAAERGDLDLEGREAVTSDDLCPLSAGLTEDHLGVEVSLADLCRLAALRSDNTASDMLVRLVGDTEISAVAAAHGAPQPSTGDWRARTFLEAGWGEDVASLSPAARRPVHRDGIGFFPPLRAIASVLRRLESRSWHPWSQEGAGVSDLYKGGTAPGVIAAAWSTSAPRSRRSVVLAVNSEAPYGAMDDVHLHQCGDAVVRALTVGADR